MEYIFREKEYKVSKFKTFLTNQLKSKDFEMVFNFLIEFIEQNHFEFADLCSILERYIEYAKKNNSQSELIFDFVSSQLKKLDNYNSSENILSISTLFEKIDFRYALNYIDENLQQLPNNTKGRAWIILFKSDIFFKNGELDKAFSQLRDCSNHSYNLSIFDSLELKRIIYERMAIIAATEHNSDSAINFYTYYCVFQASLEFLHFPYLDTYRNFRLSYSIVEYPEQEIIQIDRFLKQNNFDLHLFNSFLQRIYEFEIPKAFKLENIDMRTFSVSEADIKDLTYYSNYISNLSVQELASSLEILSSNAVKDLKLI